jgi:hypothetical protein
LAAEKARALINTQLQIEILINAFFTFSLPCLWLIVLQKYTQAEIHKQEVLNSEPLSYFFSRVNRHKQDQRLNSLHMEMGFVLIECFSLIEFSFAFPGLNLRPILNPGFHRMLRLRPRSACSSTLGFAAPRFQRSSPIVLHACPKVFRQMYKLQSPPLVAAPPEAVVFPVAIRR